MVPLDFVNRGEEKKGRKGRKKDGARVSRDIFEGIVGKIGARESLAQSFRQTYLLFHLYEAAIRLPIYVVSFSLYQRGIIRNKHLTNSVRIRGKLCPPNHGGIFDNIFFFFFTRINA